MKPDGQKEPRRSLLRDTAATTLGMGLRTLAQASTFVIVARALGAESYGAYVAILAIASALSHLSGLGSHIQLVRTVAHDPSSFNRAWGLALAVLGLGIAPAFIGYLAIMYLVVPVSASWYPIILIGVAELVFWPLARICAHAYQGLERMNRFAVLTLLPAATRLVAALALLLIPALQSSTDLLLCWAALYAAASLLAAALALVLLSAELPLPTFKSSYSILDWMRQGTPFALWGFGEKFYLDLDKVMLARMASLQSAGFYGAAHRIVDLLFLPVYALLSSASARLFRAGSESTESAILVCRELTPKLIAYTVAATLMLILSAPLVPAILGNSFEPAVDVLYWLAWLPLLALPRILVQAVLNATGQQQRAVSAMALAATLNFLLNLWLIPLWDWRGAVLATYLAEATMGLTMLLFLKTRTRSNQHPPT